MNKLTATAGEVGRLQSGKDAECRLFRKIAEQGHYARFHFLDNVRGQTPPFPARDRGRDTDQPRDGG